ncbi:GIY-YIG catalytic domain-containing endonuclease [Acanthocystis turfacea Chlorella virus Br0604L]|nr:GIY-YIG catalytic domain-containing endonuclease [Acanthocystis turfacea Chlorella virus Br0604L]
MGFIYRLTSPSNKSYIGQTIRPILKRFEEHQDPDSPCVAISRAIQKHGWENMKKEWIEIPDDELNFYEELLVALLGTLAPDGYNLREGGGNGKWCEEVKQKMSDSHIGITHTDIAKQKMSTAHTGKNKTVEVKQKMSEAKTGENHPMYGKTGENHPASKKVYQYTIDGMFVQSYASIEDATQSLNKTSGSVIGKCANGKRKTAYGFKWSFTKL